MPELLVISALLIVIMVVQALPIGVTLIIGGTALLLVGAVRSYDRFVRYPPPRWFLIGKLRWYTFLCHHPRLEKLWWRIGR